MYTALNLFLYFATLFLNCFQLKIERRYFVLFLQIDLVVCMQAILFFEEKLCSQNFVFAKRGLLQVTDLSFVLVVSESEAIFSVLIWVSRAVMQ